MKKILILSFTVLLIVSLATACAPKSTPEAESMPETTVATDATEPTTMPTEMNDSSTEDMPEYFVYTANEGDATVSVINMSTMKVDATVSVGEGPHNVQTTPDGKYVYVVENKNGTISGIDTMNNSIAKTINLGVGPSHIVFSEDSSKAYVTVAEMEEDAGMDMSAEKTLGNVYVVDLQSDSIITKVPVAVMPHGLRLSTDVYFFNPKSCRKQNMWRIYST